MKKLALPLIIGALAIGSIGLAQADPVAGSSTTQVVQRWTVEVGPSWSTNSHSATNGEVIVDYAFEKSAANSNPVIPSIYLDDVFTTSGKSSSITDLGVAVRQDYRSSGSSITPYAGIGVSAFYLSAGSANTTGISGKVFGGVEFSSSWLLEIHYAPRTDYHGVDLSGYGVDVGYRF